MTLSGGLVFEIDSLQYANYIRPFQGAHGRGGCSNTAARLAHPEPWAQGQPPDRYAA